MTESTTTPQKKWSLLIGDKTFTMREDYQQELLKLIVLTAVPMLLGFAIFNKTIGFQTLSWVQFGLAFFLMPMLVSCCFYKMFSVHTLEIIILSVGVLAFQSLLVFDSYDNGGLYWSFVFPFLVFFTVGLFKGWHWILAYIIIGLSIVCLNELEWITIPYSLGKLWIFLSAFLFYTFVAAIFAGMREKQHFELKRINVDLTEARKIILASNKNLEQLVQNRTRELNDEIEQHKATNRALKNKEEQFYQAQKMDAIGTLIGGIAHDFNNMLSGMNANIFMVKRDCQDKPDTQDKLKSVEQLIFYASDMISQLLTFARKDHIAMQSFNATAFFAEAYKLAIVSLPERVQLQRSFISEALYIEGNTSQLQQVMMNLINNASDALVDSKKPIIRIQLEHIEVDKALKSKHPEITRRHYLKLSIRDNGSGIEASKMEQIFEPFFTTKDVGKGTGLGLAMCYGAIQSHDGFIDVQSEIGKGTKFSIYLPLQTTQTMQNNQQESTAPQQGQGELILVVDDDNDLRQSNAEVLEFLGYETLQASNGLESVQLFKKHQDDINLVFMDVMMPVMGGCEAAKRIHKVQANMPILFTTGYDKDSTLDGLHPLPFGQDILSKPFTVGQLSEAIHEQLSNTPK